MAIITGLTAERMEEIEDSIVTDGYVSGDDLILQRHDGSTVNAGNVRGAAATAPPVVSSLPGSPTNLQEVYLQTADMLSANVVWHMKYLSSIAKWVYIGGAPWFVSASSSVSLSTVSSNTIIADLGILIPASGTYDCIIQANASHPGNNQGIHLFPSGAGYSGSGGSEGSAYCCQPAVSAPNAAFSLMGQGRISLTGGQTLKMGYFVGASGGSLINRRSIKLMPVYLD